MKGRIVGASEKLPKQLLRICDYSTGTESIPVFMPKVILSNARDENLVALQ